MWWQGVCLLLLLFAAVTRAGEPRISLDEPARWVGLEGGALESGETASFRYPEGEIVKVGLRTTHSGTRDWRDYAGIEIVLDAEANRELEIEVTVIAPPGVDADERVSGRVRFRGAGRMFLPWRILNYEKARSSWMRVVQGFDLKLSYADGGGGRIGLESVALLKAPAVSLEAEVRGRAAPAGESVTYRVRVGNPLTKPQSVALTLEHYGWEAMPAGIEPQSLTLAPGEEKECLVTVEIPENLPPGQRDQHRVVALGSGGGGVPEVLEVITSVEVPSPYLLHTSERWAEVREKAERYDWAAEARDELISRAAKWEVPEPSYHDPDDTWGPYLFHLSSEGGLMASAMAWQLTGEPKYAEKVADFLRHLADPEKGYRKTYRACHKFQVHEGHFFQHVAMAYDMIRSAGFLDAKDEQEIEETFRAFMETMELYTDTGSINNWNVAEVVGAFYCALAIQDLVEAERWFSGPSGICDQLRFGTMDDGWWYECSVGYGTWVARQMIQAGLAYQPWGIDFLTMRLPAGNPTRSMLAPELNGGELPEVDDPEQIEKPYGMDPKIYGPARRPYRKVRDLLDGLVPFLDWRSVMFGVNDSPELTVTGGGTDPAAFEIGYYVFRDPAYASVIKRGGKRGFLFGVPELPEETPEPFRESASADNVGLVMLRSQTPGREAREQIQAAIHYGTHGWAHGHYDRTNLLSLMRYGRSFYNPESVWHSYRPFLYKFYVQTSVSKNMVVVDRKMQAASPGELVFFQTGKMLQAAAVEVEASWSYPPYGGMVYSYVPVDSFAEKCWREGRSVPIPDDPPGYGELTGHTEPIRQRRLMVVTDDYVVLLDSVKGEVEHEFESLFQMKGFQGLEAEEKDYLRHTEQWDPDPLGAAQFVTDCDWFQVSAPAVSRFEMKFGAGADNRGTRTRLNEPGVLKLDVHTLWPPKQEIMLGTVPEDHGAGQRVFYRVLADGELRLEGKLGAWTLGKEQIDVNLEGVSELVLETRVESAKRPSLFWGAPILVTWGGGEIPLSELPVKRMNLRTSRGPELDYEGGPVKIQGARQEFAIPAQPAAEGEAGILRVDLEGVDAVRLKTNLGADFPPGPEAERRKTMAVKAPKGKGARFVTLIEPYEDKGVVRRAEALSDSEIRVELKDGRVQKIRVFELDGDIRIEIAESKEGKEIRREIVHGDPRN